MRIRIWKRALLGLAVAACAATAVEQDASACGGCFAPPGENNSVVTDHRMILSVSSAQTTLWDQIRYSGSPSSFAWVLPVSDAKQATIGLSADVVFASLDRLTQTTVQQPPLNCPPPPSDCFGGGALNGGGAAPPSAASDAGAVTVIGEQTVGPYQVDFLHSTDANALNTWLTAHGFAIPADIAPVIGQYVTDHFDFIAMKLVPGTGVQSMRPVRVTTPGAAPVLPLRMVAAGVGPTVGITLWVLGEGRYNPQNFPFFTITDDQLVWDWSTSSSNYSTLRAAHEAADGNKSWEIESSLALNSGQLQNAIYNGSNFGAGGYAPIDGPDGGVADGGDSGAETVDQVRQADLDALFAGINTNDLRVTRIRGDISRTNLTADLVMQASTDQAILSNIHQVKSEKNEPLCPVYNGCNVVGQAPRGDATAQTTLNNGPGGNGKESFSCATAPRPLSRPFAATVLAGLLGLIAVRARRRRR